MSRRQKWAAAAAVVVASLVISVACEVTAIVVAVHILARP